MRVNKGKSIPLFLVGIIVVFILIVMRNSFKTELVHAYSNQNLIIYNDQLSSQFSNWSWNSMITFDNHAPVYSGTNSILFNPSAWGGLYLHSNSPINTASYKALQFAIQTTDSPNNETLLLYDTNNQLVKSLSLIQYAGVSQNGWTVYTIPVSNLPSTISGLALQESSGNSAILYIDSMQFTAVQQMPANANPFAGQTLFNDMSADPALQQELLWQKTDPIDAQTITKIAQQPKAIWVGSWVSDVQSFVQNKIASAYNAKALPVFVAYNIPERDCGGYSSGGANSAASYQAWIDSFAKGINTSKAAIILEPDALAQSGCLTGTDLQTRLSLLSYAVQKFKSLGQTSVYIDAGHSGWITATTIANLLKEANVAQADGFSLNVSNFQTTGDSIAYGRQISGLIGGKHFVIDTSRNGNGPTIDNQWCNPQGRALGVKPSVQTGISLVDAYLWIKYPGESDGNCNGGPAAGVWYPSYALGLAQKASW